MYVLLKRALRTAEGLIRRSSAYLLSASSKLEYLHYLPTNTTAIYIYRFTRPKTYTTYPGDKIKNIWPRLADNLPETRKRECME